MDTVNSFIPKSNRDNIKFDTQASVTISDALPTPPIAVDVKIESLRPQLSKAATIYFQTDAEFKANTERWSTYKSPTPSAVVNVATEGDVVATVKWALTNSVKFLARTGAHGFSYTLGSLGPNSIIINMRGLNSVSVDLAQGQAHIGGGAVVQEVVEAAHKAGAHVMTGVCNAVGVTSPCLGGGVGYLMALYGLGVDNMIEANVITATGDLITVSAKQNTDLWWGLRGAGHNFGIVSQMTVKAHEQVNGGMHWTGVIGFPGSKENVMAVTEAINSLGLGSGKPLGCTMLWGRIPPEFHPTILVNVWYGGPTPAALEAFAPLLALNPMMNQTGSAPYPAVNAFSDFACIKNGHPRPSYGTSVPSLKPNTLSALFEDWLQFTEENPDAGGSVVLTECYDSKKVREVPDMDTAYPWRAHSFNLLIATDFTDLPGLEGKVQAWGDRFRDALGEGKRRVYVNFAAGDESLEAMYGSKERLDRLRALKAKWDPEGSFSCFNPIK